MEKWNEVKLVPEFSEQGVDCYRLAGGDYENKYYVVSEAETRKLLNTPEVVGYEVLSLPDSVYFTDALLFLKSRER